MSVERNDEIIFYYFFFFQAEDGIRDYKVTGVQTCALPICGARSAGGAATTPGSPVRRRSAGRCGGAPPRARRVRHGAWPRRARGTWKCEGSRRKAMQEVAERTGAGAAGGAGGARTTRTRAM